MTTTYSSAAPNMLAGSMTKYQDIATRLSYYLLMLIACFAPWGDLFRLGREEGPAGRGVTTVLGVTVIVLSLLSGKFFSAIVARPRVLFFAAFVLLGTGASLVQDVPLMMSLRTGFLRGGYWILMVAVVSLHLDSEKGRSFVRLFALSTALMSLVSVIDYYHIVDIPRFNETYSSFLLDSNTIRPMIGRSMTGPFVNRGYLATYLAFAWPIPLMELIHGKSKNPAKIILCASVLAVLTLAVAINYARALYVMVAFTGLYAIYSSGHRRLLRIVLIVAPLLFVFFLVAQSMFPDEMVVLTQRIESLHPEHMGRSAAVRTTALQTTMNDLLTNPQGMGFGLVEIGQSRLLVHSIFTEHIRPAGFLGFVFVCLFMWPIFKMVINRHNAPGTMVLCASLLGVLGYGVAHSTHSSLPGWIVIGFLYSLSNTAGGRRSLRLLRSLPVGVQATRGTRSPPRHG